MNKQYTQFSTMNKQYTNFTFIEVGYEGVKMSLVMRKPAFCICENKDTHQLRSDRKADQRLCFRYTDSKIPLLTKCEISSF